MQFKIKYIFMEKSHFFKLLNWMKTCNKEFCVFLVSKVCLEMQLDISGIEIFRPFKFFMCKRKYRGL